MPFSPSDPVYACFRSQNDLPVGQEDTNLRLHRVVIGTPGEWNISDTFKIKDLTYLFFGYMNATDFADPVVVQDSNGNPIATTTTGQGTSEITVTFTESAPVGNTLTVAYRAGIPGVYVSLDQDRANVLLDCHNLDLDGTPTYLEIFAKPHRYLGATPTLNIVRVDGFSIQSNPPA